MYVQVAPAIPLPPDRDIFTYAVKQSLPKGTIVNVPFGHRFVRGVVVGSVPKKPVYRTKSVARIYPATLTLQQLACAAQIQAIALGGLGFTLRLFYPPSLTSKLSFSKKRRLNQQILSPQAWISPGKTRLSAIERQAKQMQKDKKQVLIVVPERWMAGRFPWARPLHAGMNASSAMPLWQDVASGKPVTVVGTQKALFLPWQNLGLIIVDEEQLPTHKIWDGYPRGDNRRLAALAALYYKASLLLAGSFPSLALYSGAKHKEFSAQTLKSAAPQFAVIPFSFDDRRYGRLLPAELVTRIQSWKRDKHTIVILHNETDSRVAKALQHLRLLKKGQVTIGTSALFAKLKDQKFDHVVWMFPERTLSFPDIRSGERGYILLARLGSWLASSRQGVLLISRQPEFVERSFTGTLAAVYKRLLAERGKYLYPPYADMVRLTFRSRTPQVAQTRVISARELIAKKLIQERDTTRILGPYGSPDKHLLLLGKLASLAEAYHSVYPDIVDVDPERVL